MCRGCCWGTPAGIVCGGAAVAVVVVGAASWTCLVIASIARSSPTKRSFMPSSSTCIRWLVAFSAASRSFSLLRFAFSRARMSRRAVASSRRERRVSSSSRLRCRELAADRRLRSLRASLRASTEVDSSEPVMDVDASETVCRGEPEQRHMSAGAKGRSSAQQGRAHIVVIICDTLGWLLAPLPLGRRCRRRRRGRGGRGCAAFGHCGG